MLDYEGLKQAVGQLDEDTAMAMIDQVKVIIGGNPVTEQVCKAVGADAWTHSPQETVNICNSWCKER